MREILFRGKRVDNGEWVQGYLSFHYVDGKNKDGFVYNGRSQIYVQSDCKRYDVITETVGQYTGFTDQNKNKIFEGDILELSGSYKEVDGTSVDCIEHYEVKYKNAAFYACSAEHKVMLSEIVSSMEIIDSLTIIGNIHEIED